ncbi:hypothetical protein TPHA_0B04750 [Tetrapisispora phaffii CBS 4417]|uniref:Amino acid permease/ SLC12A domain-containing protein n=1 Tax=Tetrapisispora phaffii (strain ATCC 24235 / CBS 4417 / NBRC 1672 / NRRL Y-8282 / UCD 70-5) TaxID=1071381 RepID=G8BQ63_TETPH|nr:hypothetical protein TPHA_0B04750 [Tetrapisispora phaffii CBS 4417]CCE62144.1 hypothetical protein TPHA_0B04750 [Tetrapisispora phaffii CBS 4417]
MSDPKSGYEMSDTKAEAHVFSSQENEVEYLDSQLNGDSSSNNSIKEPTSTGAKGHFKSFVDSFRRGDHAKNALHDLENDITTSISHASLVHAVSKAREDDEIMQSVASAEHRKVNNTESDDLQKTIKPRHVIMISLGTGIGTGLLVGNSSVLSAAGPAPLVIGYSIMGSCLYCIIQAAGEMAVVYSDLNGGFNNYPSFLLDPALGFSVAWVYCLQWLCVCPLELVTASLTIKYWTTKVDPDVFVIIFYVLIISINVFGARGYAEAEFFFNVCKVLMMIGFFILGIIITAGGAGNDGYLGAKYWHEPGAFRGEHAVDRFKGVMDTFVAAAFAFGATEFIALTAAEQSNPRKAIPSAAKKVLYRIVLIFLVSIIMLGFLVPYDSDQLLGSSGSGVKASPYVLAVSLHGVRVVPHFINAVILLSVLSVGNSAFYSSSRLLLSLSQQGYAPKWFDYVDRQGRPARAMLMSALFGVIAFCATSPKETDVFNWLLAISGLSQLFTWFAICMSHVRFRYAMKVQGRSIGEVGFHSQTGVYGSLYAATMMILALMAQFWVAIAPLNEGKLDAQNFFQSYLAMPILIALYFGYKLYYRDWKLYIKADKIDLISHRQIFDENILKQEDEEYKEKLRNGPAWRRIADFWC